jgi:hypothetical protein
VDTRKAGGIQSFFQPAHGLAHQVLLCADMKAHVVVSGLHPGDLFDRDEVDQTMVLDQDAVDIPSLAL